MNQENKRKQAASNASLTRLPRLLFTNLAAASVTTPGTILVVAISGGADSVAMLHALAPLAIRHGLQLFAAHLNHGIRPEASADADFVKTLCARLGIGLTTECADVPQAAAASHRSIEMQAREMRYAFFKRVADARHADAVLTAHTLDDQAETLLLNLCRGSGPAGLGGIPPSATHDGVRIIRPLLNASRGDIETYLFAVNQSWHEDITNQDTAYRRNAVRHRILPLLKDTLNPQVARALSRAAAILRDDNELLDTLAHQENMALHPAGDTDVLLSAPFRRLPLALRRRILVHWLRQAGLPPERTRSDIIERIDTLSQATVSGGSIRVSDVLSVRHEYDRLRRIQSTTESPPPASDIPLTLPGITLLPDLDCQVEASFDRGYSREPAASPGTLPAQVHLRWDPAEPYTIRVRPRSPGDRIAILGMEGSRKVQDILTDAKIPERLRDRIPVFTIDGNPVWIPGSRPSRHWAVPTQEHLSLRLRISTNGFSRESVS